MFKGGRTCFQRLHRRRRCQDGVGEATSTFHIRQAYLLVSILLAARVEQGMSRSSWKTQAQRELPNARDGRLGQN